MRRLALKRSVYDFKKKGMKNVILRNRALLSYITICMLFRNSLPVFKEVLYNGIMNWTKEGTPSDIEFEMLCVTFITLIVQYVKNVKRIFIDPHYYTFLTEEVLPEMWRSRKEIELKRQRKPEKLANLLDNDERYQEAHVIRIIVKPHLERMNRKWTNMTALERFKSLFS